MRTQFSLHEEQDVIQEINCYVDSWEALNSEEIEWKQFISVAEAHFQKLYTNEDTRIRKNTRSSDIETSFKKQSDPKHESLMDLDDGTFVHSKTQKQFKIYTNSAQKDQQDNRKFCRQCGKTNHNTYQCFYSPYCTYCQSYGHIVKSCRRRMGTCILCGIKDHISLDCPKSRKPQGEIKQQLLKDTNIPYPEGTCVTCLGPDLGLHCPLQQDSLSGN